MQERILTFAHTPLKWTEGYELTLLIMTLGEQTIGGIVYRTIGEDDVDIPHLKPLLTSYDKVFEIQSLIIDQNMRMKGYGKKIMDELHSKLDGSLITITCDEIYLNFLQKMGYKVVPSIITRTDKKVNMYIDLRQNDKVTIEEFSNID